MDAETRRRRSGKLEKAAMGDNDQGREERGRASPREHEAGQSPPPRRDAGKDVEDKMRVDGVPRREARARRRNHSRPLRL